MGMGVVRVLSVTLSHLVLAAVCALPARGEEAGGAPGTLAQHKLNPLAYSLLYVDGPWVNGILVSRLWSVAGRSSRQDVSVTQIEMQVSYTFSNDWYIQMSPTMSHDRKAPSGQRWVIPIGVDVGRTFTIGSQGISLQIGAYDNVKKPTGAAEWVLDTQVSWLY